MTLLQAHACAREAVTVLTNPSMNAALWQGVLDALDAASPLVEDVEEGTAFLEMRGIEGTPEAGFPDEIAPRPEDYVFLKRRPSAFYGTGVAELLHMLRRDIIIIGGGATNRGVETSVREAFSMDVAAVVVRECCWGGDAAAHAYSLDKAMKMYARIRALDQVAAMLRG